MIGAFVVVFAVAVVVYLVGYAAS